MPNRAGHSALSVSGSLGWATGVEVLSAGCPLRRWLGDFGVLGDAVLVLSDPMSLPCRVKECGMSVLSQDWSFLWRPKHP